MLCALHVVGLGAWGVVWVKFISCIILSYPLLRGQVCMMCALDVVGLGVCEVGWVGFISCIILSYPPIGGQVCMLWVMIVQVGPRQI